MSINAEEVLNQIPKSWRDLITLPVSINLAGGDDGHDGSQLYIGRNSPLAIEMTNRSNHNLQIGPVNDGANPFHLRISLRPHTLLDHHAVYLDEVSTKDGWQLQVENTAINGHRQVISLSCSQTQMLEPGQTLAVRLMNLAADGFSGSRATHATVEYANVSVPSEDKLTLSDRLMVPLSIVHAMANDSQKGGESTQLASNGVLAASLPITDSVMADSVTRNFIQIELQNISGSDIKLTTTGDRIPTVSVLQDTSFAGASLVGHGYLKISDEPEHGAPEGWTAIDGHRLEPSGTGVWWAGTSLYFFIEVVSSAAPGQRQLHLSYSNFPGVDPGTVTLVLRTGLTSNTIWSTDFSKTVRLWGDGSTLELRSGILNDKANLAEGATLSVSAPGTAKGHLKIEAPYGTTIDSPNTTLGDITTKAAHLGRTKAHSVIVENAILSKTVHTESLTVKDDVFCTSVEATAVVAKGLATSGTATAQRVEADVVTVDSILQVASNVTIADGSLKIGDWTFAAYKTHPPRLSISCAGKFRMMLYRDQPADIQQ